MNLNHHRYLVGEIPPRHSNTFSNAHSSYCRHFFNYDPAVCVSIACFAKITRDVVLKQELRARSSPESPGLTTEPDLPLHNHRNKEKKGYNHTFLFKSQDTLEGFRIHEVIKGFQPGGRLPTPQSPHANRKPGVIFQRKKKELSTCKQLEGQPQHRYPFETGPKRLNLKAQRRWSVSRSFISLEF